MSDNEQIESKIENRLSKDLAESSKRFAEAGDELNSIIASLMEIQSREKSLSTATQAIQELKSSLIETSLRFGELSAQNRGNIDEMIRLVKVLQESEIGTVATSIAALHSLQLNLQESTESFNKNLGVNLENKFDAVFTALDAIKRNQRETITESTRKIFKKFDEFNEQALLNQTIVLKKISQTHLSIWIIGTILLIAGLINSAA